jgi:hypothetical protein
MQVQQRTAGEWFVLWDELADVRRKIGEQYFAASAAGNRSECERLWRAFEIASARSYLAQIRFLMAKYNLSESDIEDLGLTL